MSLLRILLLVVFATAPLALVLCGCTTGVTDDLPPPLTPATLRSAPSSVELDGRSYELESHVWRDFMPPVPPEERPLTVLVQIREKLGRPVGIEATRLWVFHEDGVWETKFSDEPRPTPPELLEKIARDGPKWKPGTPVDVAVLLVAPNGRSRVVGVQGLSIGAPV